MRNTTPLYVKIFPYSENKLGKATAILENIIRDEINGFSEYTSRTPLLMSNENNFILLRRSSRKHPFR